MPLGSVGAQGYPDDQHVSNWDPAVLAFDGILVAPGTLVTPIFNTSRYAGVYMNMSESVNLGRCVVAVEWSRAAAFAVVDGARYVYLPSAGRGQVAVPVFGPYCRVRIIDVDVANVRVPLTVMLTNRVVRGAVVPDVPWALIATGIPLAASVSQNVNSDIPYSGSVWWYTSSDVNAMSVTLQTATQDGVWIPFAAWTVASGTTDGRIVPVPPGFLRAQVKNTGAVTTSTVSILGLMQGDGSAS